ncbi:hypothetical protein J3458_019984 [Metarhizium acridum]|uniref:uncharacterized protein n=1 Tax=Metarhizium acridum TaxID=92637 RepID=UPI001C6B350D|nr:hypothetical protein J3458_019984 [Metarhizium acridum]
MAANATVDYRGHYMLQDFSDTEMPQDGRLMEASTVGAGSVDNETAVNCTEAAVRALWLSLSIWLKDFPRPASRDNSIGLWTASYGGHYAPALYDFAMQQNARQDTDPKVSFHTIGLINACVDALVQLPAYPDMAYNNTYDYQLIDKSTLLSAKDAWERPHGCKWRVERCRRAAGARPYLGNDDGTNTLCRDANAFCGRHVANIIGASGRNFFDIGQSTHHLSDPGLHTYLSYLRQTAVQHALGVPVNFTDQATEVARAFTETGDNVRGDYAASLGRALDNGVRVSLVYGDRDYACNWLGGEALSLSFPHKHADAFRHSGFQSIRLPAGAEDGVAYVRQRGNLSFVRVLDSGHTVNTAWPSVGFTVFNRTARRVDVSTGCVDLDQVDYSTKGSTSTWHVRNALPVEAGNGEGMCYTLALSFCSHRQLNAYLTGSAVVQDYWIVDYGDGTCSPNPVRPCKPPIYEKSLLPHDWISRQVLGSGWADVTFVMSVVIIVAFAAWTHLPTGYT